MALNKNKVLFVYLVCIGFLLRYTFSLIGNSGDLEFYLGESTNQLTVLGLQKSILFFPFRLPADYEIRLALLCIFLSVISAVAITVLREVSGSMASRKEIIASAAVAFFLYQIDLHLVRQQIGMYFFLIFLGLNSKKRYGALLLACLFHEVFAIFALLTAVVEKLNF